MPKTIVFEDVNEPRQEMKVFKNMSNSITFEIYDIDHKHEFSYENIALTKEDVQMLIKDLRELLKNEF